MDIDNRLYVRIEPYEGHHAPVPHPVRDGRFDVGRVYKVIGMYNPSETSEAYFVLSNETGQIWFISNRHLRAVGLHDSKQLSMSLDEWHNRDDADAPHVLTALDAADAVALLTGAGTSAGTLLHRSPQG